MIRIALGSDHAGFRRKQILRDFLVKRGYQVADLGCPNEERCDYPDYARRVADAVVRHRADKGVLVCGTGIGMAIAANKVRGIRAAVCWNPLTARMATEHNWANVVCVPGRLLTDTQVKATLKAYLDATPEPGRHKRRIDKITRLDKRRCP